MQGCSERLIRCVTATQVRFNGHRRPSGARSAHALYRTAGDLLLSEMVTLASGSRTMKLLPALARHGVPLTADTFGFLRGALQNASGDEVVREVLAASGRNYPALIACSRFSCQGGGPFPHHAGQCVGHVPQSGQSIADSHATKLANACDAVTTFS